MKRSSFLSMLLVVIISLLGRPYANAGTTLRLTLPFLIKVPLSVFETISQENGNGISGSFVCSCKSQMGGPYHCAIAQAQDGSLHCGADSCCGMSVTTDPNNLAITSGSEDGKITWKVLVIPKTTTTTTSN